ncbi:MAG: polysaccharide deacetylase family protein [Gammaproteobacteria bacterium]|nr:polysaccharide deacetylase family protein [Gammaproteobacteria bacterium]
MLAIVSIHDVMPSTLDRVRAIVDRLPSTCMENLVLLVVPGLDWSGEQIAQLREWQSSGIHLAGHGWTHETGEVRGLFHRLHSLFISRTAAEHLSLSAADIEALMNRNHAWFGEQGLEAPDLYVPPAWALGAIDEVGLARTPWRYLETTSGLADLQRGRKRWLPLAGFEADTRLRQWLLTFSNTVNVWLASHSRPLRISIHPFDGEYLLAAQMDRLLGQVDRSLPIGEVFSVQ